MRVALMDLTHLFNREVLVLAAVAIAAILLLWNRLLRSRVDARTAELNGAMQSHQADTERLADLYHNVPCGYHSLDANGIFVEINDTELRWLGCSRNDVIGKLGFADFLEKSSREKFRIEFARLKSDGASRDVEFELVSRAAGAGGVSPRMTVMVSSTMLPAADGRFVRSRSTVYDITEQVRVGRALRATLDYTPHVAIQWFDRAGRVRYWNKASTNIFGWNAEEAIGRTLDEIGLCTPAQARNFTEVLGKIEAKGHPRDPSEVTFFRKDRTSGIINFTLFPIPAPSGEQYFACMVVDVTAHREAEKRIGRLNRVYAVLSNINAVLVRIKNRQELIDEACRIAVEHGGFGVVWIGLIDHAAGRVNSVAWAGADAWEFREIEAASDGTLQGGSGLLARCIRDKRPALERDMSAQHYVVGSRRRRAVELGYRSVIILPLMVNGEVVGLYGMMAKETDFFTEEEVRLLSDLAGDVGFAFEIIEKENRINYLAYYDSLTGLPNRMLLIDRLGQLVHTAAQRETKLALIVVDVRRFRFVNESAGRQSGDNLLRELGQRLQRSWRDPDDVGRIAGDRFALVLGDFGSEAELVHAIEQSIIGALRAPFMMEGREVTVSVSAGVAVYPEDGAAVDALFKNAEAALKQAKAMAEPYLFYQPQMNARMAETLLLENHMRRALDKEQFVLHYQPKVEAIGSRVAGFEALIRWNDPASGLVAPGTFIPIIEETGMIVEAGHWALCRVLHDQASWRQQGLTPPRVAVNVSAVQLRRKDFTDQVRELLNASAVGSDALDLEITESLLMNDMEGCIRKLSAIRDLGVNIAIDDFGTGYSSLAYLSRLPVNALKIDRSFITGMLRNSENQTIVSSIISLAHALNMKVIAEGVETQQQLRMLQALECDEIQGYLISPPVAANCVADMLREHAALEPA
jgi:diguanylate cyclase (GGDEF)-like protein/PAS domain S-box-containing protein